MSSNSKKYLITTEKHEVFIVQKSRNQNVRGYCVECHENVELLTIDEVTTKTGRRTRELFQLIESDFIHSIESGSGHLLICLNSIAAITDHGKL